MKHTYTIIVQHPTCALLGKTNGAFNSPLFHLAPTKTFYFQLLLWIVKDLMLFRTAQKELIDASIA